LAPADNTPQYVKDVVEKFKNTKLSEEPIVMSGPDVWVLIDDKSDLIMDVDIASDMPDESWVKIFKKTGDVIDDITPTESIKEEISEPIEEEVIEEEKSTESSTESDEEIHPDIDEESHPEIDEEVIVDEEIPEFNEEEVINQKDVKGIAQKTDDGYSVKVDTPEDELAKNQERINEVLENQGNVEEKKIKREDIKAVREMEERGFSKPIPKPTNNQITKPNDEVLFRQRKRGNK